MQQDFPNIAFPSFSKLDPWSSKHPPSHPVTTPQVDILPVLDLLYLLTYVLMSSEAVKLKLKLWSDAVILYKAESENMKRVYPIHLIKQFFKSQMYQKKYECIGGKTNVFVEKQSHPKICW